MLVAYVTVIRGTPVVVQLLIWYFVILVSTGLSAVVIAIVGYITVIDLTKTGDLVRSRTFEAFFSYISVALIYLIIVLGLTWVQSRIEKRLWTQ